MKNLQSFLRYTMIDPIGQLKEKYGINAKRHSKYPNLVCFKYSQVDSPMGEKIVQESRGIILDEANEWSVVSRPYDKFFNLGEGHAAEIDWSTAKVLEKLDGSLMQLYYYNGEWLVGSSGTPDACGEVGDYGITFAELFWKVFDELNYHLPVGTSQNNTFLFELMTPLNQVVVRHNENKLVLHGIREIRTGTEFDLNSPYWENTIRGYNWSTVESYNLFKLEDIEKAVVKLDPMKSEGFIVVDKNFNRVKIKSPSYVALHRSLGGVSKKSLLEVVRTNEGSEILLHFPNYKPIYDELQVKYLAEIKLIDEVYSKYRDIETQKDFALAVKDEPWNGILFSLRKGTFKDGKDALEKMPIDKLLSLIGE